MRRLFALPLLFLAPAAHAQDLNATIADALAHAPALAEAQADEALAKARLDGARAQGHPLVAIEGEIGAGRIDNGGFFGFAARNVTPLALKAGAEMPLYAGGRVAAAMDQARGGVEIARLGLADARSRTMVGAVAAYAEVLTARRIEARFAQLTSELTEVERQAGLRFKTGEIPASDLAAATARRAEGDAGFANAEGRRISAEAQYRRLTGHDAGALAPLPALPETPPTLDEALDAAHRANPALAQAEKAIDIARAGSRSSGRIRASCFTMVSYCPAWTSSACHCCWICCMRCASATAHCCMRAKLISCACGLPVEPEVKMRTIVWLRSIHGMSGGVPDGGGPSCPTTT